MAFYLYDDVQIITNLDNIVRVLNEVENHYAIWQYNPPTKSFKSQILKKHNMIKNAKARSEVADREDQFTDTTKHISDNKRSKVRPHFNIKTIQNHENRVKGKFKKLHR